MRKASITLDADDRRAIAGGAAAGLGLMTLLALRADWLLASGVLAFRQSGRNVAAYVLGLDLLPWTLVFTAILAAGAVLAVAQTFRRTPDFHPGPARQAAERGGRICGTSAAHG